MYMRVTRGRITDPSKLGTDTANQVLRDLVAAVRRQPGFQSFTGGADRANGRTITISTWDTEDHARFSPEALGDLPARIEAIGIQVEPFEVFEVTTPN